MTNIQEMPVGINISTRLSDSRTFEDRARQFGFYPLRAAGPRQAIGFITYLDQAPAFIAVDQDIIADLDERFCDFVSAMRVFLDLQHGDTNTKFVILLRRPLSKSDVKWLRNMGISGVLPQCEDFDYYLNQRAYEEIVASGNNDHWPKECVESTKAEPKHHEDRVTLTDRQQEVQKLLCERGLSNKAIARQLNISESTVKIHVSAILKRYGVRNRTQLALAVNNGARL